ncbi:hypothetical protein [Nocardia brasiliensis]
MPTTSDSCAGRSIERDATLAAGEVDRTVDVNGKIDLANGRLKIGTELAGRKVASRLAGHLVHVVDNGVLAKTLPSPATRSVDTAVSLFSHEASYHGSPTRRAPRQRELAPRRLSPPVSPETYGYDNSTVCWAGC